MTYKILYVEDGQTYYARIDDDGLIRLTCAEDHPPFKQWLEEGNTPLPADDPS